MIKKLTYIFLLVAVFNTAMFAQTNVTTTLHNTETSPVPMEQVFVHLNSSLFFVGEYVYYKVYVNNLKTEKLSKVSKIAYFELINENKKSVLKQKIQLVSGTGQGDFFIPTTIPSGNYKVVSYTLNMLSKASDNYFQQDISIINPYRGNQSAVTKNKASEEDKKPKRFIGASSNANNELLSLKTDKEKYSKRSPVSIQVKQLGNEVISGDYSISVRKNDTVSYAPMYSATNFKSIYSNINYDGDATQQQLILPELRGELITGLSLIHISEPTRPY